MKLTSWVALFTVIFCITMGCGGSGSSNGSVTSSTTTGGSVTLTASPMIVTTGQPVTLTWSSTGTYNHVSASSGFSPTSVNGSVTVNPTSSQTYSITVSNSVQTSTSQVAVAVPTLTVTPAVVPPGQLATLSWSFGGGTLVPGSAMNFSPSTPSGSVTETPTSTTKYSMSVSASGQSVECSATLTVSNTAPYAVEDLGTNSYNEYSIALSDNGTIALGLTGNTVLVNTNNGSGAFSYSTLPYDFYHPQVNTQGFVAGDIPKAALNYIWIWMPNNPNYDVLNDEAAADYGVSLNNLGQLVYYSDETGQVNPQNVVFNTSSDQTTPLGSDIIGPLINDAGQVVGQSKANKTGIDVYLNSTYGTQYVAGVSGIPQDLSGQGQLVTEDQTNTTYIYSITNLSAAPITVPNFNLFQNIGNRMISSNVSDPRVIGLSGTTFAVYDVNAKAALPITLTNGWTVSALGSINANNNIAAVANDTNHVAHLVLLTPASETPAVKKSPVPAVAPPLLRAAKSIRS